MNFKLVDKTFGLLLIIDLLYPIFIFIPAFGGIFELYHGIPLMILVLRIVLHFGLGITAAILFFRHLPVAKWALSGYVGIALLGKYWLIKPNTDQYLELVKEFQASMPLGVSSANVVVKVSVYPFWWVWILYFIGLIYVFTIRQGKSGTATYFST